MDATQIIIIVFIVLLVIAYPILISSRNKKENQKLIEQTNSLKRGDRVLTTSGVYGTVVDLHLEGEKKIVTIQTGVGDKKGYLSVDAFAIYTIFEDETATKEPQLAVSGKRKKELEVPAAQKAVEAEKSEEKTSKKKSSKTESSTTAASAKADELSESVQEGSSKKSKK